MAMDIEKIARLLGAEIKGQVPEVGGGTFGATRLARAVDAMRVRPRPRPEQQPDRPTDLSARPGDHSWNNRGRSREP